MPEAERAMMPLEFYRRIGCDVMQFGGYGLPEECRATWPARAVWPEAIVERTEQPDGTVVVTNKTPWGTLISASRNGHPVKPSVETLDDLRVLRSVWEHMRYEEVPGHEESFRRVEALIGDRGIYLPTLDPSPVQQLIEVDMGAANFYYLLQDATEEMEALLGVMHERRKQEYEIVARRTPAEAVIPVENTSSTLTSPAIYERYSLPQIRDYCDIMHRRGKKVILHMCGLLRNLLPIIRRTGCDGYNATTPPTVGDTTFDVALDILGRGRGALRRRPQPERLPEAGRQGEGDTGGVGSPVHAAHPPREPASLAGGGWVGDAAGEVPLGRGMDGRECRFAEFERRGLKRRPPVTLSKRPEVQNMAGQIGRLTNRSGSSFQ